MTDSAPRVALYFGCWRGLGHCLHRPDGAGTLEPRRWYPDFPWTVGLMDSGLLRNGGHPDAPDGRVYWTCGGRADLWYALLWWDRSVDRRGASNSGFYVRGFPAPRDGGPAAALAYACEEFPHVVARQPHPLRLVE